MLTNEEKRIVKYIEQNTSENLERVLTDDCSWEAFYYFSIMRNSILNWYDFDKNATLLEIGGGFGAITTMFCEKCKEVVTVEIDKDKAKAIEKRCCNYTNLQVFSEDWKIQLEGRKFKYVVCIGVMEWIEEKDDKVSQYSDYLKSILQFMEHDGKLLIAVDNQTGIRCECGILNNGLNKQENGFTRCAFSKKEINQIINDSGIIKRKFYYPLPDYILTQEIYSESYLPQGSIWDRVIPYYVYPDKLKKSEIKLYDESIANGTFEEKTNSFLVECTLDGELSEIIYAAVSTDRGKEHGFATIIRNDMSVEKKALYSAGESNLNLCFENSRRIDEKGIPIVRQELKKNSLRMPYVKEKKLVDIMGELGEKGDGKFVELFEKFVQTLKLSSTIVSKERNQLDNQLENIEIWGEILEDAYIDMIPLNCFFINNEFVFFDQEFVRKNYPLKYIMFRAIRYTYLSYPKIENSFPIDELIKYFKLEQVWSLCLEEEDRFIWNNRRHEINHQFYQWAIRPNI